MDEKKFDSTISALLDGAANAKYGSDANDYATAILKIASAREKLACDDDSDEQEEDFDPEELIDSVFSVKTVNTPLRFFVAKK